ncbi:MAG TPA: ATP-binding protein, partial [Oligoflexia bacterium]|nr:ATP-binding protein [Oligoflexia bacterium]
MQTYFSRQEKLRGMHLLADTVKSKDHEAAVLLSVPVYDGQKLKGLISAKIPVEALRRVILTGAAHSAVCLLLLDSDGTILLSSEDPRLTGRNFLLDGRMELSANARAGLHRFARIVHSGEMRSATYSGPEWTKLLFKSGKVIAGHGAVRAGGQKWPLVLTVDYEDVHQPVKQHARSIFVSIEFIVLSLIGVIWLLHKSQERRLELEISARSAAALKAAYDKLQSSEELLRQVLDASPVCIYAADTSGRVLLANNSFGNLVRMKPEKTIGRTVVECALSAGTLPEYASRLIAEDRNVIALQEELHLSERRCQMTDGTVRWFQISKTPLVLNGKAEFVLGIIADITSRIVEQENREKLEAQLQHMQKMESLGVLAGGVAHDFNNLLACIVGNAEMAISELDADSMAYECLQQISAAAERAGALADQMLAYSGKGQFSVAPIDLSKLIREMGHLLRTSISKKTKLNFDLADALPVFVGDSAQISQVVMNLMLNGAEALEGEYGTISIATGTMHCTKKDFTTSYIAEELPEGEYAFVEIKDTGCGMDDETLRKIFDPFFTTKFFGRGLGLAAALGIIRGHHGAVWIDSSPGKGTTFRVCFPAAAVCAVGRPANKERTAKSSSPATVLIIDDEEMVLGVAGKILRQAGYKVVTASDGHEALTRLKHAGMEIQLVILDLNMPEISGREILAEIRKLSSEMRVILSSGYSE